MRGCCETYFGQGGHLLGWRNQSRQSFAENHTKLLQAFTPAAQRCSLCKALHPRGRIYLRWGFKQFPLPQGHDWVALQASSGSRFTTPAEPADH